MGRSGSDLDDYLDWQSRLDVFRRSGLSIGEFCREEGVSRSTYHRWVKRLKAGIPDDMLAEKATREKITSGAGAFVPVRLKPSLFEIELPNGAVVRLPGSVEQAVLTEVIRVVGELRPRQGVSS